MEDFMGGFKSLEMVAKYSRRKPGELLGGGMKHVHRGKSSRLRRWKRWIKKNFFVLLLLAVFAALVWIILGAMDRVDLPNSVIKFR